MWSRWLLEAREGCTIMAFTSRSPREGVSTVVAGLARTIGAIDPGRVLALDVTPGLQENGGELVTDMLEIQTTPVWIQDIESDNTDLSNFVTRNIFRGTDILSIKYIDRNRPTPQMIKALLDRLRTNYHIILMDVGSLSHGDRLPWLFSSDYRILVIDASTATREVLEHQQRELEHMGITINGSILNKRTYPIPGFLYWLAR
jgi:MinD-like ATPase involved in chromosome partitioning or flagellar assembly